MLKSFLSKAKQHVASAPHRVAYVVGNEAADLDSVASAISLAYLWKTAKGKPLVPVVNNRKEVLSMRGEIIYALSRVQLSLDDLIYANDLPSEFDVILADHNEPSLKWKDFKYNVLSVFDHHADGGLFLDASPRVVRVCASTCSIVTEICDLESQKVIGPLLEAALVFDTVNWTWRVTEFDVQMAQKLFQLESLGTQKTLHDHCAPIMQEITDSLIDESQVDPYLLMFKDYKAYKCAEVSFGISVAHIPLSKLARNDNKQFAQTVAKRFMDEEQLDILVILTAVREPGLYTYYQEFATFCRIPERLHKLVECLSEPLQLVPSCDVCEEGGLTFAFYDLLNLEYSRKKIAPMIQRHLLSEKSI